MIAALELWLLAFSPIVFSALVVAVLAVRYWIEGHHEHDTAFDRHLTAEQRAHRSLYGSLAPDRLGIALPVPDLDELDRRLTRVFDTPESR